LLIWAHDIANCTRPPRCNWKAWATTSSPILRCPKFWKRLLDGVLAFNFGVRSLVVLLASWEAKIGVTWDHETLESIKHGCSLISSPFRCSLLWGKYNILKLLQVTPPHPKNCPHPIVSFIWLVWSDMTKLPWYCNERLQTLHIKSDKSIKSHHLFTRSDETIWCVATALLIVTWFMHLTLSQVGDQ
jgi:hypothetical protein